jgi:hypothetical protein
MCSKHPPVDSRQALQVCVQSLCAIVPMAAWICCGPLPLCGGAPLLSVHRPATVCADVCSTDTEPHAAWGSVCMLLRLNFVL